MKIEKKSKGWIIEELEKKNECLDADSFGGENPEDVEKQREENAKEINKRFKKTIENGEKVVGEDHVELPKVIKESKEFKKEERKEMGAFIEELKTQGIKHTISRSSNEGYRWNISYEKLEESRGGFVKEYKGCRIIERPDIYVCTDSHGSAIGQSKTIPGCEGLIDAWNKKHGIKESFEKTIIDNLVAFGICDNEEEAAERVARMNDDQKRNWLNSFASQGKSLLVDEDKHDQTFETKPSDEETSFDAIDELTRLVYDCLSGVIVASEFKGKEVRLKDLENAVKFALVHLPDKFDFIESLTLEEPQETLNESMKSEVTKWWHDVEDANREMKWDFIIDNGDYTDIEGMHAAMFDMLDELKEKGAFELVKSGKKIYNKYAKYSKYNEDLDDEDLPDAIPEEPIVVSTEVPEEEVVVDEVTNDVVDNGIYLSLSSELRDTLQDIENLKGLTVTLATEEGREEIIDELNTIIDDRTIHTGILQGLMEKVDTKVEPVEEVEVSTEE